MIGRLFIAAFFALITSATVFAIVVSTNPQSLTVFEPLFCEDSQTLEINQRSTGRPGEFTLDAACIGDDAVDIALSGPLAAMFGAIFVPVFPIIWLLIYILAASTRGQRERVQEAIAEFQSSHPRGNVQTFTTTVHATDADPNVVTDTLGMIQEALSDGVITRDEFERINARVGGANGGDVRVPLSKRLAELQNAFAQDLITQSEYDRKRREILDEF